LQIRVAYDIAFLAKFFMRPGEQSGIFRVVEELLYALNKRDDVDLTVMGFCGADPLLDAVNSFLYTLKRKDVLSCKFDPAFKSRMGLTNLYLRTYSAAQILESEPQASTLQAGYVRVMRGLLYRLAYTYKLNKIEPFFDDSKYDVFHSPFLNLPPASTLGGTPRVLTIYDLIFLNNPEFLPSDMVAFLRSMIDSINVERDWVACISEFTKQQFCEHTGMSLERVFVTPLAAASHFRPVTDRVAIDAARKRYGIPDGNYFLGLGVLQPRKNLSQLIRCFIRLLEDQALPNTYLVVAGARGWKQDEIFAEAAGIAPEHKSRVIFTGHIPDEDLAAIYSGAVAFVYPSLYEGFGLPPLEAMACGTAVITSNTTALPEVVGEAGLMVDPRDEQALCQAMLEVLGDEALREELSRRGIERAAQFTWAKCAEANVGVYKAALAERGKLP
jgi:glycosyltransferase involved in cell wall biosynthesis